MSSSFIKELEIEVMTCEFKLHACNNANDLHEVICKCDNLINICNVAYNKCDLDDLIKIYHLKTDLDLILSSAKINLNLLNNLNEKEEY